MSILSILVWIPFGYRINAARLFISTFFASRYWYIVYQIPGIQLALIGTLVLMQGIYELATIGIR